jgi:hypothetical protein
MKLDAASGELEKEWYIDRTLMANASTLSLADVVLGSTVNRNWFILPGVVASFLIELLKHDNMFMCFNGFDYGGT